MSGPAPFADHFSAHAADYARARPTYPPALFAQLAALAPATERAWDAGTGSGQAATALATHFRAVVATDASAAQLGQARPHPRVAYAAALAEAPPLADGSCDLVTVAQALHWFDVPRFCEAARRVLRPGGVVAVWAYDLLRVEDDAGAAGGARVDHALARLHAEVAPFWPPERVHVQRGYADLPFPFAPVAVPPMRMTARWPLAALLAYLRTWSAVRRYATARGTDPVRDAAGALAAAWGDAPTRAITWPLHLRVGRVA